MNPRLALILLGSELVRGDLVDANHRTISHELEAVGVEVASVHFVPDDAGFVSALLQWLRPRVDYVITVGGLGPTADDVTMAAIAQAFQLRLCENDPRGPDDYAAMSGSETRRNRLRHFPAGSEIINTADGPVVRTDNVYSLPGLPRLVAARLPAVINRLRKGVIHSRTLHFHGPQSLLAPLLESAVEAHSGLSIGCYPAPEKAETAVEIVGEDEEEVERCMQFIQDRLDNQKAMKR